MLKRSGRIHLRSNAASGSPSTNRTLEFENLEHRQVLATGIFDATTATLTVDLGVSDIQLSVSEENDLIKLSGSTDLDPTTSGDQTVNIADVENIAINGVAGATQSLILRGSFSGLTDLTVNDISHVDFDGEWQLAGDLTIAQSTSDANLAGRILDTPNSILTVAGSTTLTIPEGNLRLENGETRLNGDLNFTSSYASADNRLKTASPIRLANVQVANTLRIDSPEISDTADSNISIFKAYLKSDAILIGETNEDAVEINKLNFKSTGTVSVVEDTNIELIGRSYADTLNLVAQDWITDAEFARTAVTNMSVIRGSQITLGELNSDSFETGQLSFTTTYRATFAADGDLEFADTSSAGMLDVSSTTEIRTAETANLLTKYTSMFRSDGDILIGTHSGDTFMTETVSFIAPNGHVEINENATLHIIDSINIANSLKLVADGNITDDFEAKTVVTNLTEVEATESVYLGEGVFGEFATGSFTFDASGQVLIEHNDALMLAGENSAETINLFSRSLISNEAGSQINITERANFNANAIDIGRAENDSFNAGWIAFDSDTDVHISADSDLFVNGSNSAEQLMLETAGDMMLAGTTTGDNIYLRATGAINNVADASLTATQLLDLVASSATIGNETNDRIESGMLTFQTANDTRLNLNSNVLLAGENFAKSFELFSDGNVTDMDSATIHADLLARIAGVDVILGDAQSNCFHVTTNNVVIEAAGLEELNMSPCPIQPAAPLG